MITPITHEQARGYSGQQLAFIGDSVYGLMVRLHALGSGSGTKALHLHTTGRVNAVAQSKALTVISSLLDETELDIVRRGRNAHARHGAPRSATGAQYAASTGFEALIGYLFLTGQMDRTWALFQVIQEAQAPEKG